MYDAGASGCFNQILILMDYSIFKNTSSIHINFMFSQFFKNPISGNPAIILFILRQQNRSIFLILAKKILSASKSPSLGIDAENPR